MDTIQRGMTIAGLQRIQNYLLYSTAGLAAALLIALICLLTQSKIVILQIPGVPSGSEIQKNSMEIGAQRAILLAVTSNLVQVNPANAEYQKNFLQAFLAPAQYTKISAEIDAKAKMLAEQRELGSYYFVLHRHEYDPKINRHFVLGDVHTVNAAKDTGEPYVFEYTLHVENYRPVIDDVTSYKGDKAHNSGWLEAQKR
jgi:conjugal transfer pilus assembly protein TraE